MNPIDDIVEEQADGSAIVTLAEEPVAEESGHFDNLAESIDRFKLNQTASNLLDQIEKDKESRKKRDEQYEEGIRRTGLGDDAPGGATFSGASKIVHPVLAEGCVDFSARAMKELFPSNGPVKTKINSGNDDRKVLDRAKRKRDFLNWQLTTQIKEYRSEKEILLTQLPLGGSQYEKYWYDPALGRIRMEFVPIDDIYLPYAATSFYTSPRVTHEQKLTEQVFEERIRSGFYIDVDNLSLTDGDPEQSASAKANEKIEGKESSGYNEDGVRIVYEVQVWLAIEDEEAAPRPYIVHLDESSGKVLAIYRNWAEEDEKCEKLEWYVEDKFIPWRGIYGIGLPHLIGGMAAALTGSLRALLDSAHINNAPTAIKLKGGRASGQNTEVAVTAVQEIDAPAGVDDIRKVMMPMPFNPPSPVLFQLLDWITGQAKGVVATAEEKIADATTNMPVGTTLALIEQGSQVFSSIHARLHASQAQALAIICRLNRQNPDAEAMAKYQLTAEDFAENDDIQPVSDPNIFSEAQRYAQLQEEMKLVQMYPDLGWERYALAKRALELLRCEHSDEILPKRPDPVTADPVSENVAALNGTPLKAVKHQDHQAHIQTHLTCILNPLNTAMPGPMPQLGAIMTHVQEHLTMLYEYLSTQMLPQAVTMVAQNSEPGQPENPDAIATMASNMAAQNIAQVAQQLTPLLQQAGQVVAQKSPQPPVDPAVQKTFEAAMAEIQRKTQADQQRLAFDQQKAGQQSQMDQMQMELDRQLAEKEQELKFAIAQASEAAAHRESMLRAQVEQMKNEADNQQHQQTEIIKNLQDNQTQLQIALRKQSETPPATPEMPDFTPHIEQLNKMMGMVEQTKSSDALTAVGEGIRAMIAQMNRPKMIIEDENGKPIGVQ